MKKTDHNTKLLGVESKYFTTAAYNKFMIKTLDAKLKQKELVDKYAIAGFLNNADLNTSVLTLGTKVELKAEHDKMAKFETYDLDHFLGQNVFGDGSQNRFVYQPAVNTLELKTEKGSDYVIGWKSKGVYNSKLVALYGFFT